MSMTLDEAIALVGTGSMDPQCWEDSCDKWVGAMIQTAVTASSYAWGIISGAYEVGREMVKQRLRDYWCAHACPEAVEEEGDGLCEVLGCGRECTTDIPITESLRVRICPTCLWYRLREHAPYICSECDGPLVHETSECLICKGQRPAPVEEWTQITPPDLVGAGFISGAADEEDGDGFMFYTRSDTRRREFRVHPVEGTKVIISERTGGDAA